MRVPLIAQEEPKDYRKPSTMADESFSMEIMDSVDKIHNRFRVDPVHIRDKRGSISQKNQRHDDDEDDAYPEETMKIIARRSSR